MKRFSKIKAIDVFRRFMKEEDGIALSEYLVVLGLMIGGVIVAVTLFGTNLGIAWDNWADWIVTLDDGVVALMTP
ncbi:Flp pilus assembly protein, pilin Flp [Tritonibacter multivorans]|uniref:Flp pilus assembly protein, pilin Flp n=1 Tax=Tritonibacter multivorans TaxID=928856 RepID=A0A0N7LYH8_9RHOB|nr:hypothetical protein [Tritonibacter multivorans]MDA7422458.1 hypothetical protein [Tritonibacter multivorans]CUH74905.1 Flp pilus assembly protein, pilin Flp [Tritonibacter multivorans]SFD43443.1 pilus assembly protein Flp/PilA [Tritonibacter multivorans]